VFDMDGFTEESGEASKNVKPAEYKIMASYYNCMNSFKGLEKAADYCRLKAINRIIAERHLDCWEQFGKGELPMFDMFETKRQCVVCSVYDFKPELKEKLGNNYQSLLEEGESFNDNENDYPQEVMFDYVMRAEYPAVAGQGKDSERVSFADMVADPLDIYNPPFYDYFVDEPYASVFIANHESFVMSVIGRSTESVKDLLDRLPFIEISDEEETHYYLNTIEFLPESEIVKECDLLVEQ
jgi:hypothetical protein